LGRAAARTAREDKMANLFLRSLLVLALLFGLLFAIGMGVLAYFDAPLGLAVVFAIGILLLQYLIGPWIIQLIYKIEWADLQSLDPGLAEFVSQTCADRRIPPPRFGLIRDGNPNAFTFGHYPGDARLVVTTGLLELLDPEERKAVVAHELGHIAHWDFVVMTLAAAVPLILYVIYSATIRARGRRGRSGGYALLIALISYVAYIVSHYIVLLLSRVREYYADRFSAEATRDPGSLGTALVKVAYGLAAAPTSQRKDDARMTAARAFGIFDPKVAQTLALSGAGSGGISPEAMESAMRWDLWNPWAMIYEISSTHPLPAKRIRALERQAEKMGRPPRSSFRAEQPESYWDEFLLDLVANYLPVVGVLVGGAVAAVAFLVYGAGIGAIGAFLAIVGAAWWAKRWYSYPRDLSGRLKVRDLLSTVKVSAVRSVPGTLEGKIIGRGVPGLFYSEDLVLQDDTGFVIADYRQPFRILEILFGWIRAEKLIGRSGEAAGWYRRSPRPYFELRRLKLDNGEVVTSYYYPVTQALVYLTFLAGLALITLDVLLVFGPRLLTIGGGG
jgi:heat shock protein HtpX